MGEDENFPEYDIPGGPQNLDPGTSALDVFKILWATVLPRLVDEINFIFEYSLFLDENGNPTVSPVADRISYVTEAMLLAFFGIWMYQRIVFKPEIRDYWRAPIDPYFESIGGCFRSYWQWEMIFRALFHLSDEFLFWMEEELNRQFVKYWKCFGIISIDEMMIRFKGRSRHKVFEPSKPARRGLKYYALVDVKGYLYRFKMHKNGIVLKLYELCVSFLDSLTPDGLRLFACDNYYGSFALLAWCTAHNIVCIMTMRSNRPTFIWDHVLKKVSRSLIGSTVQGKKNTGETVLAWKDKGKKHTLFLTNLPTESAIKVVEVKRRKGRGKEWTVIPQIAAIYTTQAMGHVDSLGQTIVLIGPKRKNTTWRRCDFLFMLKITISNVWIIDKILNPRTGLTKRMKNEGIHGFQRKLAELFVEPYKKELEEIEKAQEELKKRKRKEANQQYWTQNSPQINKKRRRGDKWHVYQPPVSKEVPIPAIVLEKQ